MKTIDLTPIIPSWSETNLQQLINTGLFDTEDHMNVLASHTFDGNVPDDVTMMIWSKAEPENDLPYTELRLYAPAIFGKDVSLYITEIYDTLPIFKQRIDNYFNVAFVKEMVYFTTYCLIAYVGKVVPVNTHKS